MSEVISRLPISVPKRISNNYFLNLLMISILILAILTIGFPQISFDTPVSQPYIIKELPEKATANSRHFLMSNGQIKAEIYSYDIQFQDQNGIWRDINTTLQGVTNGFIPEATEYTTLFPKDFTNGYSIELGEDKLSFIPIGANGSAGILNNDKASVDYLDAWTMADVNLKATESGIKETITLKAATAPSSFTFLVNGNLSKDLVAGNLKLEPAWLIDAKGTYRDVSQVLRQEGNKTFLDLRADVSGLSFPVMIDPSISNAQATKDTYFNSNSPANYGSLTTLKLGATVSGSNFYQRKPFFSFDVSSIPAGSYINIAMLNFKVTAYSITRTWDTSGAEIKAGRIQYNWAESDVITTYPNGTLGPMGFINKAERIGYVNVTHAYREGITQGLPMDGVYVELTDYDQNANLAVGDATIASKEHSTASYRPYLDISYSYVPTAPTVTSPNNGITWTSTKNITWIQSTDQDTAQSLLKYQIQLSTDNGISYKDIIPLTPAGVGSYIYDFSGEPVTSQAKIRIRAYDGLSYSAWGYMNGSFSIVHDAIPPTLTVTPSTTEWTNQDITITATATDDKSGVKQIQLPNGTWVPGSSVSHTVSQNGTYTFIAEDNANNRTTQSITITNIDKDPPIANDLTFVVETNRISLIPNASDAISGLTERPFLYNKNGLDIGSWTNVAPFLDAGLTPNTAYTYYYKTVDKVGNESSSSIKTVYTHALNPTKVQITDIGLNSISIKIFNNSLNGIVPDSRVALKVKGTDTVRATTDWSKTTDRVMMGTDQKESYDIYLQTRNEHGVTNPELRLNSTTEPILIGSNGLPSDDISSLDQTYTNITDTILNIPAMPQRIDLDSIDFSASNVQVPFNLNDIAGKTIHFNGRPYYITQNTMEVIKNSPTTAMPYKEYAFSPDGFVYSAWKAVNTDKTFSQPVYFKMPGFYETTFKFKTLSVESEPAIKGFYADWINPSMDAKPKQAGQSVVTGSTYTVIVNATDNISPYLFYTTDNTNWYVLKKGITEINFTNISKSSTGTLNNLTISVSDLSGNKVQKTFSVWGIQK